MFGTPSRPEALRAVEAAASRRVGAADFPFALADYEKAIARIEELRG
ncbi:MAG: hypothetical protein KatS3mg060_1707 [Dehalococcoidia bacterium]|nr:MAG: hypothetical protein KatS3mg060_1707 [Dehalococcoidia bacterium]